MATENARIAQWKGNTLPHTVDRLARELPDSVYGLWPIAPTSYEAGFRTITYSQLANIVNGLAWWIVEHLESKQDKQALAYLGPNDVRVPALLLAAIKAGHVLFLTSPRNSLEAQKAMFDSLKCQALITSEPPSPAAVPIIEKLKVQHIAIPSVEELLCKKSPPFIFNKTFEQARWDPLCIFHTSGSTGFPKPLIWNQETAARQSNQAGFAPPGNLESIDSFWHGKRLLVTVPPFHGAGMGQYCFNAIPFGTIVIAPAAVGITTAQGLVDSLKQTPADVALLVPSVVAELAQNDELLDYCANQLQMIVYIGGDLPQAIGDRVAARIPLHCQWGASEVGIPQQLLVPELGPTDWRYTRFHPCTGATFDEITDGTYELVIPRDHGLADTQPSFSIRGQTDLEQEYRTRDLFEPHPTVTNAWRWKGRVDDIIVFLNGEKTNPISMEQHIVAKNPELSGALVVGTQRLQAALIIEPVNPIADSSTVVDQTAALIEQVWPSVVEANRSVPAHAKVEKSLIMVTTADRPLIRAGKGTIQRAGSITQYTADIHRLYENAEYIPDNDDDEIIGAPLSYEDVKLLVQESIHDVTGWSAMDDSTSLFDQGMDSLQALQLTRLLRRGLGSPDIGFSTIYQNPTIPDLTSAFTAQKDSTNDCQIVQDMIASYRELIHQIQPPQLQRKETNEPRDVVLTGSTGALGSFLLRSLLDRPGIGHVFCLNRRPDGGRAAEMERFITYGLSFNDLDTRVTFVKAELTHPSLGLDNETYEKLRRRVGLIVHNAWPVNFNLPVAAFRPQLDGIMNLFKLSAASECGQVEVIFVSSVGAVQGRPVGAGPAPEAVLQAVDAPHINGYASSKFIAELICDSAAQHLKLPVKIARIGQVAGNISYQGSWNRSEWFPSLIISSLWELGCLPDSLGQMSDIDWVPLDILAQAVVDIVTGPPSPDEVSEIGLEVFNFRNPQIVSWNHLLPAITDVATAPLGSSLEVVPASIWLEKLSKTMASVGQTVDDKYLAVMLEKNPAIKLTSFYDDLFSTKMRNFCRCRSRMQCPRARICERLLP